MKMAASDAPLDRDWSFHSVTEEVNIGFGQGDLYLLIRWPDMMLNLERITPGRVRTGSQNPLRLSKRNGLAGAEVSAKYAGFKIECHLRRRQMGRPLSYSAFCEGPGITGRGNTALARQCERYGKSHSGLNRTKRDSSKRSSAEFPTNAATITPCRTPSLSSPVDHLRRPL